MEKRALYLEQKKILNSTHGNKLRWHAGLVHSDKSKNAIVCLYSVENKVFLWALMDKIRK